MADRGDTHYKVSNLNRWFLISSVLLLVSSIWMVWDDWAAEWKPYQREFRSIEAEARHEVEVAQVTQSLRPVFEMGGAHRLGSEPGELGIDALFQGGAIPDVPGQRVDVVAKGGGLGSGGDLIAGIVNGQWHFLGLV
jgi:hypothetical protein